MSQTNSRNIIHPKILAIQNHINLTNDAFRKKDYLKALDEMDLTTMELFPEDQPEELITEINKEIDQAHQYAQNCNYPKEQDLMNNVFKE